MAKQNRGEKVLRGKEKGGKIPKKKGSPLLWVVSLIRRGESDRAEEEGGGGGN